MYPGCIKCTKLSAFVNMYNLKAKHWWSNYAFSEFFQFIEKVLPENNEFPSSMYEDKKTMNALGLEYKKNYSCPHPIYKAV